jgi:hypothetical protein
MTRSPRCAVCRRPFTAAEWEDRHSDSDGPDVHAHCCPVCIEPLVLLAITGGPYRIDARDDRGGPRWVASDMCPGCDASGGLPHWHPVVGADSWAALLAELLALAGVAR